MKFDSLPLRLESIIERELELRHPNIRVVGSSSPISVALLLTHSNSNKINYLPHLVVVPRMSDAVRLQQAIQFFDSRRNSYILPHFDVSPFSGLEARPQIVKERIRFLHFAQNAKAGDIFIAPITSLQQKTTPFSYLNRNTHLLKKGSELPGQFSALLNVLGYEATPMVEDVGQYSIRGGIIDIFSPAHDFPIRIELFGDSIESLRTFSVSDQKSFSEAPSLTVVPAKEAFYVEEYLESLIQKFKASTDNREIDRTEEEEVFRAISRLNQFQGQDFLLPFFFKKLESPLEHFSSELNIWSLDPTEIRRQADQLLDEMHSDYQTSTRQVIRAPVEDFFDRTESLPFPEGSVQVEFSGIDIEEVSRNRQEVKIEYSAFNLLEVASSLQSLTPGSEPWLAQVNSKFDGWKKNQYRIFISVKNKSQAERLRLILEKIDWKVEIPDSSEEGWYSWAAQQEHDHKLVTLITRFLPESVRLPEEKLIFLRDEDLLGKKMRVKELKSSDEFQSQAKRLSFGDLKPGDFVVHIQHGIGIYEGLKPMKISGVDTEYIQVGYKDKDKLYLPVYRVAQLQRYSGASQSMVPDKLGGQSWEKTKTKVRSHLRDIANSLLELYAKRAELHRPSFEIHVDDFLAFESSFPYDETEDQLRAIQDFLKDMTSTKPMDRLICGDVGFGKTEVAMRAAFIAAHNQKQVAILAPTTVLSFQHLETFKKRFHGFPFEIRALNRFVSTQDAKKTLADVKAGKVDILIGTHRIFSKDVEFKNLGLLVIDEEQKFGVVHKEKIRKLRTNVDTLAMSATPIPRTLNMSLVGIRDLSIINTAPVDRLPTRTFISKWDEENIRKAIESEILRGGQVYFIHNRVQSIYGVADEIRKLVPTARIRVGHGQMSEDELEKTMVSFFSHEIDVLVCTTIVESGMDVAKANTMFIDQAHMMGLSQLYQLRGRVGRSKQRAYCYLILPRDKKIDKLAQERLKVLQENTALGSGIRIAQYDLELRGAGNLLGEEQSGHVDSVGYELYMDLLNETVHQLRGEPFDEVEVEPEINLRIAALIPDKYISDIRIRLSYYKALADIRSHDDLEKIENELKDQFGEIPEPTVNLMGLMLIRSQCKSLGIRDVGAGLKNISLVFTEKTKLKPETAIQLAMRENKKYSITPDNRLNIRMNNITWPAVYEEIEYLIKLVV